MAFEWYLVAIIVSGALGTYGMRKMQWGPFFSQKLARSYEGDFEQECEAEAEKVGGKVVDYFLVGQRIRETVDD